MFLLEITFIYLFLVSQALQTLFTLLVPDNLHLSSLWWQILPFGTMNYDDEEWNYSHNC